MYSYLGVGGLEAQEALAHPVHHTLYFGGEATERAVHNAMVHGALAQGDRAARQVLHALVV